MPKGHKFVAHNGSAYAPEELISPYQQSKGLEFLVDLYTPRNCGLIFGLGTDSNRPMYSWQPRSHSKLMLLFFGWKTSFSFFGLQEENTYKQKYSPHLINEGRDYVEAASIWQKRKHPWAPFSIMHECTKNQKSWCHQALNKKFENFKMFCSSNRLCNLWSVFTVGLVASRSSKLDPMLVFFDEIFFGPKSYQPLTRKLPGCSM